MRQRGPQIGALFKDQPKVKMLFTINYYHAPLTSFALPIDYLLATSLCSLRRHTPLRLFQHLVVRAHPLLDYRFCLRCGPLRNEGTIAMTIILKKCAGTPILSNCTATPMLTNCSIIFKNALVPHANKLLQKCAISNKAINMHSGGPAEQHFYVWEPHRGCLNKVKKVRWYPPHWRGPSEP